MASQARGRSPSRHSSIVSGDNTRSAQETINQTAAQYYAPQTQHLSAPYHNHHNFTRLLQTKGSNAARVVADSNDLRRFSLIQVTIIL